MAWLKTQEKMDIGFWDRSELDQLRDFYRRAYSPHHILLNEKFFNWYAGGEPTIIVAQSNQGILGHWLCLPRVFNARGESQKMWWVSNWALHPDWRHLALGGFLVKFLLEQPVEVLAANMVTPEARRVMEYYGFSYYVLDRYLAVFSPAVSGISHHSNEPRVKERVQDVLVPKPFGALPTVTKVNSAFGSDYEVFWREVFAPRILGTARTAEFLTWRYLKEPFLPYESFLVRDSQNRVRGLVVLRIEPIINTKVTACRLAEFFTGEGWEEPALKFVLAYAYKNNCAFLDFYNTFAGFEPAFERAGLLKNDPVLVTEIPRLTQPVSHENHFINLMTRLPAGQAGAKADLREIKNWYTTSGDADQDRKNFS